MAFQISNRKLVAYVNSLGIDVPTGTTRLLGIRGGIPYASDQISLQTNTLDHWDDTVGIWGSEWAIYRATVEPGIYYTQNPENPNGAAHLIGLEEQGGHKPWAFKVGLHHSAYKALVQAEPFRVRRDKNHDGIADPSEPLDEGDFGIHIHWGGSGWSVGKWSAGCQVIFGGDGPSSPWNSFFKTVESTGQAQFLYYLIDGQKLYSFLQTNGFL